MKIDEDFFLVKEYLYEHDRAGIEEVSEATGVSRKSIMYLLREERLLVGDDGGGNVGILTCESCRKPINTGRMCKSCKNEVIKVMNQSINVAPRPKQKTPSNEEKSIKGAAKLQLKD
jgi:hypothetical protein